MQTSAKWTYQWWLIVSVQYDDEICDSQHSYNENSVKTHENLYTTYSTMFAYILLSGRRDRSYKGVVHTPHYWLSPTNPNKVTYK